MMALAANIPDAWLTMNHVTQPSAAVVRVWRDWASGGVTAGYVSFRSFAVRASTDGVGGFIISTMFDSSSMSASASAVNCAIISE